MATYTYNPTGTTTNYGDWNPSVGALQTQLNEKNKAYIGQGWTPLIVDSKLGPLTQAAMSWKPQTQVNNSPSVNGLIGNTYQDQTAQDALDLQKRAMKGEDIAGYEQIRSDQIAAIQDRINTLNQIYDQQLQNARLQGQGLIGSGTALLANRGLAGSMRGETIKSNIIDANQKVYSAIDAERNSKIQEILGLANQRAVEMATAKRESMLSGAKSYIENLKGQDEQRKGWIANTAAALVSAGIDPNSMSPEDLNTLKESAKKAGVTVENIYSEYLRQQKQSELDAQKDYPASYQEYQLAKKDGYTGTYNDYQNLDANRKALVARAGVSGLTTYQLLGFKNQIEDNMRQDPAIKTYIDFVNFGVDNVVNSYNKGNINNISDTLLMRSLAKVTDPPTGVREEEYRTFEDAIGSLNKVFVTPKKWVGKGRLTEEGRQQMVDELLSRYDSRLKEYNNSYDYYSDQAKEYGITIPPKYTTSSDNLTNIETKEYQGHTYIKVNGGWQLQQ